MKRFNINRVSSCFDDPDAASLCEEPSSDATTPGVFGWSCTFRSPRSLLLTGGAALSHSGKCHVSDETKRGNNKRTKAFCTIFSLPGETDILILQQRAPHVLHVETPNLSQNINIVLHVHFFILSCQINVSQILWIYFTYFEDDWTNLVSILF